VTTLTEQVENVKQTFVCVKCGKETDRSWLLTETDEGPVCDDCLMFRCARCGREYSKTSGAYDGFICKGCIERERLEMLSRNAVATFKFGDARIFKEILESIKEITGDEALFKVSRNTLELRAMDASRVAMVNLIMPKHVFDEWQVHTEGYMLLNIKMLLKHFKRLAKETTVSFFVDGKDSKVVMTLSDSRDRERTFDLLQIYEEPEVPSKIKPPPFTATVKVDAKKFLQDIEDISLVSDSLTLEAEFDQLAVKASGDYVKAKNTYRRGLSDILLDLETSEKTKASYSISYLKSVIRTKLSDIIILKWAKEIPLHVINVLPFDCTLEYWLAPRIEVE